jgi:hypothetical protein
MPGYLTECRSGVKGNSGVGGEFGSGGLTGAGRTWRA